VNLYCNFQGIDDGVFTQDDYFDFMGFLSFTQSKEEFIAFINRAFYEEDNRSVHSSKSNRSRNFQQTQRNTGKEEVTEQTGDFKKHKEQINNEEDHQDDKKSVSRYSELDKKDLNNHFGNEI